MPVTPFSDRLAVIDIIVADPYIKSLGFSRDKIYNTAYTNEKLEKDTRQIFVYNANSENGLTPIYISPVIEIDISVPVGQASKAALAAEQIIALLSGCEIGGHTSFELIAPSPVNLPCQFGFECIGIRFRYNATVFNTVKTV
ncbi:MAG: hypothetical protein MRZ61_05430 [Oscillospiraceae bacterium]|nr:hypothetical protein [Oscillospiraceae bacterium]